MTPNKSQTYKKSFITFRSLLFILPLFLLMPSHLLCKAYNLPNEPIEKEMQIRKCQEETMHCSTDAKKNIQDLELGIQNESRNYWESKKNEEKAQNELTENRLALNKLLKIRSEANAKLDQIDRNEDVTDPRIIKARDILIQLINDTHNAIDKLHLTIASKEKEVTDYLKQAQDHLRNYHFLKNELTKTKASLKKCEMDQQTCSDWRKYMDNFWKAISVSVPSKIHTFQKKVMLTVTDYPYKDLPSDQCDFLMYFNNVYFGHSNPNFVLDVPKEPGRYSGYVYRRCIFKDGLQHVGGAQFAFEVISEEYEKNGSLRVNIIDEQTNSPIQGYVNVPGKVTQDWEGEGGTHDDPSFKPLVLPYGVYTIEVGAKGYEKKSLTVSVNNLNVQIKVGLKRLDRINALYFIVIDENTGQMIREAIVNIGSEARKVGDQGALFRSRPIGQSMSVTAKARGYQPKTITIVLTQADFKEERYGIVKEIALKRDSDVTSVSAVQVYVHESKSPKTPVPNASVKIGGLAIKTDARGIAFFEKVPRGKHRISVTATGYKPAEQEVTLQGREEVLQYALQRLVAPEQEPQQPKTCANQANERTTWEKQIIMLDTPDGSYNLQKRVTLYLNNVVIKEGIKIFDVGKLELKLKLGLNTLIIINADTNEISKLNLRYSRNLYGGDMTGKLYEKIRPGQTVTFTWCRMN